MHQNKKNKDSNVEMDNGAHSGRTEKVHDKADRIYRSWQQPNSKTNNCRVRTVPPLKFNFFLLQTQPETYFEEKNDTWINERFIYLFEHNLHLYC